MVNMNNNQEADPLDIADEESVSGVYWNFPTSILPEGRRVES